MNKKNILTVAILSIIVCLIVIYKINVSRFNTIDVLNKTGVELEKIQIFFESGNGNSKIDVSDKNKTVSIPTKFEGRISLIVSLNGKTKKYIIKGYYETHQHEYIQCKIIRKGNTNDLSNLYIEVK